MIGSSHCRRLKSPLGTVLIINLLGKGLSPRACMGNGGSIWWAPAMVNKSTDHGKLLLTCVLVCFFFFKITLKDFIDVHFSFSENREREKERNKLRHYDVISIVCKLVCTLIENSSRIIIVREILVMVKYFIPSEKPLWVRFRKHWNNTACACKRKVPHYNS